MADDSGTEGAAVAEVTLSGGGYRAITTRDGAVGWACKHVHFTDRSARNCAEEHVKHAQPVA
jgi:hypothetical protein